jgi:hypothetical protein
MATTASIKVTKTFTYRGVARNWSNRYHFNGGTPPDSTHWTTLSDAITTAERAGLTSTSTIVSTTGYGPGSDVPIFNKTYSLAGTQSVTGQGQAPGDCALMVRYSTATRTRKNHPLYLFNYFHGVLMNSLVQPDIALASLVTALQTYANSWLTGFSDGATTYHRAGPNGDLATGVLVTNVIRHRDFPNA